MIIKLSKAEQKTLSALDPKQSGPKPWQSAREVGGGVFRKKPENLTQEEIRVVRNAFRKLVRETLVEMSSTDRGKYRIHDRGRKLLVAGATEFEGKFDRGEATKAAKAAGEARLKSRPKPKKTAKKAAAKKTAKKAPAKKKPAAKKAKAAAKPKKAAAKKAPKKPATKKAAKAKTSKKPATKAKSKVEVVDKTKDAESAKTAKGTNGKSNGEHKKPKFKRRQALKYANSQASEE